MGMAARDEWIYSRVQYDLYNEEMLVASLTSHFETQHDFYPLQVLNMDFPLHDKKEEAVFKASYSRPSNKYVCPVTGCTEEAAMLWNL